MFGAFFPALAALPAGLRLPADSGAEHYLLSTSFVVSLACLLGAALFFFCLRYAVPKRWQLMLTLTSLSCLVASIHYYYMLLHYRDLGLSPTSLRYLNWLISGPLLCSQFYLLLRPWGASRWTLGRLVLAHSWLVGFGYLGESAGSYWILLWGAVASLGYVCLIHEIWFGPLARLVDTLADQEVGQAFTYLSSFFLLSWLLYPLGYMSQPFQVLARLTFNRNLLYNIADVVLEVGFGVLLLFMARQAGRQRQARQKPSSRSGQGRVLLAVG